MWLTIEDIFCFDPMLSNTTGKSDLSDDAVDKQDIMMSRFTFLLVKKQKEIQIFDKNSFRIFTTVVL